MNHKEFMSVLCAMIHDFSAKRNHDFPCFCGENPIAKREAEVFSWKCDRAMVIRIANQLGLDHNDYKCFFPVTPEFVHRAKKLVKDVVVDLDLPLSADDE